MESIFDWISSNFNVLFSGLGVYVISLIVSLMPGALGFLFIRRRISINKVRMKNVISEGDVVGRDKNG